REVFYILKGKDEEFKLNLNETWKDQKDRLIQNMIPALFDILGRRFSADRTELAGILRQRLKSARSTQAIRQNPERGKVFDEPYKYLHGRNDSRVTKYDTGELTELLLSNDIYSPELSDPGKAKNEKGRVYVNVHGLSWRSSKLVHLLHNVLDPAIVPNYKRACQRSHTMRVPRPDGVPDWAAGGENQESDSSKKRASEFVEERPSKRKA
ncbi:19753_t:CDS:2, partial [Gigaspora margarita]